MKLKRRAAALLLCLAFVLCLTGCKKDKEDVTPVQTAPAVTEAPQLSAGELYSAARAAVDSASDLVLRVAVEKTTEVGGMTYAETSHQVVSYLGRGTDSAKLLRAEAVIYGEDYYSVTYQDVYADGKLYSLVDGEHRFACAADAAGCEAEMVPAVLLDASLYGVMESEKTSGTTTITFAQPTAAESWVLPEGAEMAEASGTAVVNADGSLEKTSYTVTYTYGAARITEVYNVYPTLETPEIPVPDDAAKYVVMDHIQAVRLSKQACGYLLQTPQVSSTITETMTSQVGGLTRTENVSVNAYFASDFITSVDTSVSLANSSTGETDTHTQKENFWGEYTISKDGGEPQKDDSVDAYAAYNDCTEYLLEGMTELKYWKNAQIKDLGDTYLVNCTFSDVLANDLRSEICQTLYSDADALDNYATETAITAVTGYFAVDKYIGLPTAACYGYAGTDVINGESYAIGIQTIQSYKAPDEGVYYTLTGKMPEETEPENKATPLLYRVTGADGQEMYLMGTIHVGDERTAFLPQEVYDALDASAALAVEVDILDFEKKLQTDAALQATIAASTYYQDGTTVVDHADTELLTKAEDYMKAAGGYSINLAQMKPALWANTLENFYLRQGYSLVGEKGFDRRLLMLADESSKMIINIESGEDQMEMMGSYSDGVQEMLLAQAISYEPCEYWKSIAELYEAWCRGDETELRNLLNDTSNLAEMSAEEQALYAEYQKAMITDRNTDMLAQAESYLESSHTIFFAVGLAHLLQDNGLVDALRTAGYTVQQVMYQ